jgi:hypothetical protein
MAQRKTTRKTDDQAKNISLESEIVELPSSDVKKKGELCDYYFQGPGSPLLFSPPTNSPNETFDEIMASFVVNVVFPKMLAENRSLAERFFEGSKEGDDVSE